ncbi:MAG TPA: pyruvate dehydrogenase (acetyl-transferring) E1 component subunit alpha [Methanocella sp.]|jgi:pyruvate dehydrogenase E1 component alpha subunit
MDDKFLYKLVKGQTFSIIAQDGTANEYDPGLPEDLLLKMYRWMVQGRLYDEKALKLQAAGRMGTYPPISGQEAIQVGSALAMEPDDWLVPSYRELASMMIRGISMAALNLGWMGNDYGNKIPEDVKCLPIAIPVGSQALHATGFAWAAKIRKEKYAVLCHFGDGATSRGDFHEALNFAGVYQVPAVFISNNNGWAISTPVKIQTHAETLAQKGLSYGIPSYQVDGMDVLASYVMTRDALQRAREGKGPTFIEALCYRYGAHTTADNPDLYRSKEETEKIRKATDPVVRFRNYLVKKKLWDDEKEKKLVEELDAAVDAAAKEAEQTAPPTMDELFRNVFATMPDYLKEELAYYHRVSGGK